MLDSTELLIACRENFPPPPGRSHSLRVVYENVLTLWVETEIGAVIIILVSLEKNLSDFILEIGERIEKERREFDLYHDGTCKNEE